MPTVLSKLPTMLSTPKKEGKVRVVRQGPKNRKHRQLVRDKAVPKRLNFPNMEAKFGRGAEPEQTNRELDTGNFEGPGWDCISITQAGAGRYYKALRLKGRFMILNKMTIPWSYPSHRLKSIFKLMIDWIKAESNALGYKPRHFLIRFNSELMDHEVQFKLHDLNPDIADIILHKFEKIDQSGMLKHKKESITTQEFEIDITAIDLGEEGQRQHGGPLPDEIGKRRRQRMFAGSGRVNPAINVPHNINPNACMDLPNNDAYCLFRSFEILRNRAVMKKQTFSDYKKNANRQQRELEKLLTDIDIPKGHAAYDVTEFGQKIQDHYNKNHRNKFRLFAFKTIGDFKPFWAGKTEHYEEELCVLFTDGDDNEPAHYMPIIAPGRLFEDAKSYCFACLMPYKNQFEHDWSCGHKCRKCSQIGAKHAGGCKPPITDDEHMEPTEQKERFEPKTCEDCNKTFSTQDCYNYHKMKTAESKRTVCERHKQCKDCKAMYAVDVQTKNGRQGHDCDKRYCRRCGGPERRIICYDMECTTKLVPHPKITQIKHVPNFIYAHVMCTMCIREGLWDKPIEKGKECRICGKNRWYSWCSFKYDVSKAEKHVPNKVDNPLAAFTDWLLHHWKKPKEVKKKQQKELPKAMQKRVDNFHPGTNQPIVMDVDVAEENEEQQLEEPMDVEDLLGGDQMAIQEEENKRKRRMPQQQDQKPKRKRRAPKKCRFLDMEADVEDDDGEDDMEEDELDLDDSFIAPEDELAEEMEADDYHHLNPYLYKEFVPRQKDVLINNSDAQSNDGTNSEEEQEQQSSPKAVYEIDEFGHMQTPSPTPMAADNDDLDSECSEALGIRRNPTPTDEYFVDKPGIDKDGWRIMRDLLHNDVRAQAIKKKRERDAERKKLERYNNREVVTYAYAHFGQKYDNVLVYGELLRTNYKPNVIKQGTRLYEVKVRATSKTGPISLRDSYNLIPIKLERFVDTFELKIPGTEGKQFFPYRYNKEENIGVLLDRLPSKKNYCAGGMMFKKRKQFDRWYNDNRNQPFDLRQSLFEYCASDVRLLAHGLIKMQEIFRKATGMDITRCLTLSGAAMKYFRSLLEPNLLAMTPELGYERYGRQSAIAKKFLKWLAHHHQIDIQTSESEEGEKRLGRWLLDGFIPRPFVEGCSLAIEINGCFWHACPRCNPTLEEDDLLGRRRVGDIWQRDLEKRNEVRQGMWLWTVWECEIHAMLDENAEMRAFFDNLEDEGPIRLRDAFFGGRTGAEWLYASANEDTSEEALAEAIRQYKNTGDNEKIHKTIKFKDVKSLYPAMNFSTNYPVGHPTLDIVEQNVEWTHPRDIPLSSHMLKVFIVPPRHLDVTVLPTKYHKDSRLLFSLCKKCALKYKDGLVKRAYYCPHTEDEQRGSVQTYTSMELEMALLAGYRVTKYYRGYNWSGDQFSNDIFKPYISKMMALKYQAEGWPPYCLDPTVIEEERQRRKDQYLLEAKDRYGIEIKAEDIQKNAGLKFVIKLLLNSLWGRFALRNRLSKTVFCNSNAQLASYFNDRRHDLLQVEQVSETTWMVTYQVKEEHVQENDCSNVVIAIWTTSAARVHLLKEMQKLMLRDDVRILYFDTDSILYQYDTEKGDPMEDGQHLGEMTDQYPEFHILEYICIAPKVYSLKLMHKQTREISYETKCKGFTLDCDNAERLNHDAMKTQLFGFLDGEEHEPITCHYETNFRTNNKGEIFTVELDKELKPVHNKGVVVENGRLAPFGWSPYTRPLNTEYYRHHAPPNNVERLKNSRYES